MSDPIWQNNGLFNTCTHRTKNRVWRTSTISVNTSTIRICCTNVMCVRDLAMSCLLIVRWHCLWTCSCFYTDSRFCCLLFQHHFTILRHRFFTETPKGYFRCRLCQIRSKWSVLGFESSWIRPPGYYSIDLRSFSSLSIIRRSSVVTLGLQAEKVNYYS